MSFAPTNRLVDYFVVCGLSTEETRTLPRPLNDNAHHLKQGGQERDISDSGRNKRMADMTEYVFQSTVIDRYPFEDYSSGGVSAELPMFCIPHGVQVSTSCDIPALFTFVLTHSDGARMYASCLLFAETLSEEQEQHVNKLIEELKHAQDQRAAARSKTPRGNKRQSAQSFMAEIQPSLADDGDENDNDSAGLLTRERLKEFEAQEAQKSLEQSQRKQTYYISKAFCIISHYPMFATFKSFLTQLYRISLSPGHIPIERYISNFVLEIPLPPRGRVQVRYSIAESTIMISRPAVNELPLLDVDAEVLFSVLSIDNILTVMNCLLNERQIVLLAGHFSLLGTVAETLCSIIFPFAWQHVYIPVLPSACLEFLHAPVPFLMGVHTSVFVEDELPEEVILVDLDNDAVRTNQAPRLPRLPERQHLKLKHSLQKIFEKTPPKKFDGMANDMAFALAPTPDMADDNQCHKAAFPVNDVRHAFFRFFVALFVKYRHCIIPPSTGDDPYQDYDLEKYFKRDLFLKDHHDNSRPFLRVFLETQCFQRFLLDRLSNENEQEVQFFDESITAKLKRSVKSKLLFAGRRMETKFLDDKSLHVNQTVVAHTPNAVGTIPGSLQYVYPTFPKLQRELFPVPREVGQLVTTEELMLAEGKENKFLDSWKTILSTLGALSSQLSQISHRRRNTRRQHTRQRSGDTDGLHGRSTAFDSQELDLSSFNTSSNSNFLYAITPLYFKNNKDKKEEDAKERNKMKQSSSDDDDNSSVNSLDSVGGLQEDSLFSQFCFNTYEQCPECNRILTDSDVRNGWSAHAHDYRTTCVNCGHQFVPRFSVSLNSLPTTEQMLDPPTYEHMDHSHSSSGARDMSITSSGNTGSSVAMMDSDSLIHKAVSNNSSERRRQGILYEYLSPILLKKEVENLLNKRVVADTNLFFNHPLIFWNLLVHFHNIGIPLSFFLPQVDWKETIKAMESSITAQTEAESFGLKAKVPTTSTEHGTKPAKSKKSEHMVGEVKRTAQEDEDSQPQNPNDSDHEPGKSGNPLEEDAICPSHHTDSNARSCDDDAEVDQSNV